MRKFGIRKLSDTSGDTIIEVMLSMSLLTAFLFISWGITNKATQIGINSQKRVEMVNAMKEQAEVIKAEYAKNGYSVGNLITSPSVQATTDGLEEDSCTGTGVAVSNIFHFANVAGTLNKKVEKKLVPNAENTLWIQYKPSSDTNPEYYDFYIRACWQTVGSAQNTDHAQFIVRLNTITSKIVPDVPDPDNPDPDNPDPDFSKKVYLVFGYFNLPSQRYVAPGELVVAMNVAESYDTEGYLEKITIDLDVVRRSGYATLVLDVDGQPKDFLLTDWTKTSTPIPKSMGMFAGSATVHNSSFQNSRRDDQLIFMWSNDPYTVEVNTATVEVTDIQKIPANHRDNRGGFNPKRYRFLYSSIYMREKVPMAPGSPDYIHEFSELADVNPSMFYRENAVLNPYGFYVPEPFDLPSGGVPFDQVFCNFQDHVHWLYGHRNQNPIPYEREPANSAQWYKRKKGVDC